MLDKMMSHYCASVITPLKKTKMRHWRLCVKLNYLPCAPSRLHPEAVSAALPPRLPGRDRWAAVGACRPPCAGGEPTRACRPRGPQARGKRRVEGHTCQQCTKLNAEGELLLLTHISQETIIYRNKSNLKAGSTTNLIDCRISCFPGILFVSPFHHLSRGF